MALLMTPVLKLSWLCGLEDLGNQKKEMLSSMSQQSGIQNPSIIKFQGMERKLCMFSNDQSPHVNFGFDGMLCDDLLVEILLRLPVRHLLCLRCVCKSWCALIDDINFIAAHYQLHYSICTANGEIPFICWGPYSETINSDLRVCLVAKHDGKDPLDLKPDLIRDSVVSFVGAPTPIDKGFIVGVAEGVVCFMWDDNLGLWNPSTREFKAIAPWCKYPLGSYYVSFIGFGFDCISNDFKVVRVYESANRCIRTHTIFEVYSLNTNSWKRLRREAPNSIFPCVSCSPGAYLNGVCYWFANGELSLNTFTIMSFNFSTEVFGFFNEPENAMGSEIGYQYRRNITFYKECVAYVLTRSNLVKVETNFDVWVMTDVHSDSGVPVSWQKLLTIGPFQELVYEHEYDRWYNVFSGTRKDFGISLAFYHNYVESLFPLSKRLVYS